jgi:ATP-binding cassette subfamily B protein
MPQGRKNSQEEEREQRRGMMHRGPGRMSSIEKAKDPRGAFSRLLSYLSEYKIHLAVIILLTVLSTILSLIGPYLIGVAIDKFILTGDMAGLIRIAMILTATYLASMATSAAAGWVSAIISQRSLLKLRRDLFEHMQTLSLGFFDMRSSGDLMSRLTNDIDAIGSALSQNVTQLIRNLITLVGIVVMMFVLNVWLALASLVVFPVMVVLTAVVAGRTRESFRDLQRNLGTLNGVMQETISGQRVVIAFKQHASVNRKFTNANVTVKEAGIKAMTYAMLIPPLMGILSNANIAIVAGVGAWMTLQGLATIGMIAIFINYSRRFADPLRHFANLYNSIQSALAGAERIFEIIDTQPELVDVPHAVGVDDFEGDIEFNDVDFEYVPGIPVLKKINLKARSGQTIALVGPTGAGKTTIVNLLTRFYDIKDGSIKIDGIDIREIKKDDLRRQLGIVLQDVFLFSGTVMDNIRYGRLEATDEECIRAAELANADGFIRRLPKGYYTELSERAANLSQGQRQLISIARALVADPAVLILDEATSSVDTRTEVQIQEAFQRLMSGRTSFVIAHRLSTIRRADMVLVINEGEIIERGTHEGLLALKGFYYRVYMSQFKGTNGDVEPITLTPAEATVPQFSSGGMSGIGYGVRPGTVHGGQQGMGHERIKEIIEIFKKNGATSPETAMALEELGLPSIFGMMLQGTMGQSGVFAEHKGKYYLVEERFKQMQARFRSR